MHPPSAKTLQVGKGRMSANRQLMFYRSLYRALYGQGISRMKPTGDIAGAYVRHDTEISSGIVFPVGFPHIAIDVNPSFHAQWSFISRYAAVPYVAVPYVAYPCG
jgi:hypothetical protein